MTFIPGDTAQHYNRIWGVTYKLEFGYQVWQWNATIGISGTLWLQDCGKNRLQIHLLLEKKLWEFLKKTVKLSPDKISQTEVSLPLPQSVLAPWRRNGRNFSIDFSGLWQHSQCWITENNILLSLLHLMQLINESLDYTLIGSSFLASLGDYFWGHWQS